MRSQEVLAAVLEPVLFLVKECTHDEYYDLILPALRPVFSNPGKSIQASKHQWSCKPLFFGLGQGPLLYYFLYRLGAWILAYFGVAIVKSLRFYLVYNTDD